MSEGSPTVPDLTPEVAPPILRVRVVLVAFVVVWVFLLAFEASAAETSLGAALAGAIALGVGLAATMVVTSMLGKASQRGSLVASILLVSLATVVGLAVSVGALIYAPELSGGPVEWIERFLDRLVLTAFSASLLIGLLGIVLQATSVRRPLRNRRGRLLCVSGVGVAILGTGVTVALTRWATSLT